MSGTIIISHSYYDTLQVIQMISHIRSKSLWFWNVLQVKETVPKDCQSQEVKVKWSQTFSGRTQCGREGHCSSTAVDQKRKRGKVKSFLKLTKFCFSTVEELQLAITLFFQVTVNVLDVNDEEPVCSPNFYSSQITVSLAAGTNVNGFRIQCQDRDSDPRSFRYFIKEGTAS